MKNLDDEIMLVKSKIKDNPVSLDLRLELLQYECLKGLWESALKNIDTYLKISGNNSQDNKLFRNNILCEIQRKSVFNNELDVHFVEHDVNHKFKIKLNNNEVLEGDFRDTDDRTKTVLEIFVEDKYQWISIYDIQSIAFYESQFLVDLIWRRAIITMQDGEQFPCFVPVRYFLNDFSLYDEDIALAKKTNWMSGEHGFFNGIGQKTFELKNGGDFGILDIKDIKDINCIDYK